MEVITMPMQFGKQETMDFLSAAKLGKHLGPALLDGIDGSRHEQFDLDLFVLKRGQFLLRRGTTTQ